MKKIKITLLLASILLSATLTAPALFAEVPENAFDIFLFVLAERHEEIHNLRMPEVETRTAPGFENEAVYLVTFQRQQDYETFIETLKAESIPYGFMDSREDYLIVLFYSDLLVFLMRAAIGL